MYGFIMNEVGSMYIAFVVISEFDCPKTLSAEERTVVAVMESVLRLDKALPDFC